MTSINNMWVNIGRSQFHLPTNKPQVVRGHVGIVIPDREALLNRLARLRKRLEGTCFDFTEHDLYVDTDVRGEIASAATSPIPISAR